MTTEDFDHCPACGSLGVYGLRCHPKWSIKVGIWTEELKDMVAYYAHDEDSARALRKILQSQSSITELSFERWNAKTEKWEEVA